MSVMKRKFSYFLSRHFNLTVLSGKEFFGIMCFDRNPETAGYFLSVFHFRKMPYVVREIEPCYLCKIRTNKKTP